MAAEPALEAEAGGAGSAGGLAGLPAPQAGSGQGGRTVLLALGILLLWLAGVCLFLAFEGFQLSGDTTGGGIIRAMIAELAGKAQQQEKGNQGGG